MKYIEKTIEDSRTGATATHHIVTGLNVDYLNNATTITIATYVSKAKKDEGKDALSINTFTISAVPDWSQIPYEWALTELIKPQPADFVTESYYGYVNPYTYAGGKIKNTPAEMV